MGLPIFEFVFKQKAETAIKRSQNGIVALILVDTTKTDTSYSYNLEADTVKAHWTTLNLDYLNMAFKGTPKRVLVERIKDVSEYEDALNRLKQKKWNYLAIPNLADEDVQTIADWIIAQRAAGKGFRAVLPHCSANHEGIINLDTDNIKVGSKTYSTAEFCVRVAGLRAGLSLNENATNKVIAEVESITETTTPDEDIDAGKFILINDGEKIKVGRDINSLAVLANGKTEDMKKNKIIDGMDLIRDDIKTSFEENYIGMSNSYDNKMLFVAAVNQYFDGLTRQGVLYSEYDNIAEIDVVAQREWLAQKYDVSEMSDDEIKRANTGSFMIIRGDVQFCDAIEDLKFTVNM